MAKLSIPGDSGNKHMMWKRKKDLGNTVENYKCSNSIVNVIG